MGSNRRQGRDPTRSRVAPYAFISPFYILFFAFYVFPIAFSIVLGFNRWDEASPMKWIGLRNYAHFPADAVLGTAFLNTVFYILGSIFISFFMSLPLAMMLNSKRTVGRSLLRMFFFAPIVMPPVAIAIVFDLFFSNDFGILNAVIHAFGGHPIGWLSTATWSKFSVMVVVAWQWTGLNSLYFLAGLQGISEELYEAAILDGCGRFNLHRHITLPSLRSMMIFVLVTTFIGSAQIFDQPFVLTGGGPSNSSLSYGIYLYQQGLEFLHLGYAAAIGVSLLVVVAVIAWLQFRALSRV